MVLLSYVTMVVSLYRYDVGRSLLSKACLKYTTFRVVAITVLILFYCLCFEISGAGWDDPIFLLDPLQNPTLGFLVAEGNNAHGTSYLTKPSETETQTYMHAVKTISP